MVAIAAFSKKKNAVSCYLTAIVVLFVLPQGLEPWTPTLRVSCSTN